MLVIEQTDGLASVYRRSDALKDRQLFDVTEVATAAGFKCPVAIARSVMADCAEWKPTDGPGEAGLRLMDVLVMARHAAQQGAFGIDFRTIRTARPGRDGRRYVDLRLVVDMEDTRPHLTIIHR